MIYILCYIALMVTCQLLVTAKESFDRESLRELHEMRAEFRRNKRLQWSNRTPHE